jgi:hypothetical protein
MCPTAHNSCRCTACSIDTTFFATVRTITASIFTISLVAHQSYDDHRYEFDWHRRSGNHHHVVIFQIKLENNTTRADQNYLRCYCVDAKVAHAYNDHLISIAPSTKAFNQPIAD